MTLAPLYHCNVEYKSILHSKATISNTFTEHVGI